MDVGTDGRRTVVVDERGADAVESGADDFIYIHVLGWTKRASGLVREEDDATTTTLVF